MNSQKAHAKARDLTSRLNDLRSPAGNPLMIAIVLPLLSGVMLVAQATLLANILGRTIAERAPLSTVTPLIAAIAAILVVRILLTIGGEFAGQAAAERIKLGLRSRLFAHVLNHRHALALTPASGAVSAAIADQTEVLEAYFARYIPALISAAILPIAFAVVLFPVDWIIALLFLFTAPLIPVFMALAGMGAQAATDRQARSLSRLSGHFADRLRGLLTLKLFGQEKTATEAVHTASEHLRLRTNAVLRIAFLSSAILEFFAALGVAGVALYVGLTFLGFLPFHPELTLVKGLFALIMAPEIYQPLRHLAAHYHDRASAKSALEEIEATIARVDALDTLEPAALVAEPFRPVALAILKLHISTQVGRPVLERLDLQVAAGTALAIMGPSGIGKTTLARAIARLIPFKGGIAFDGLPLDTIEEGILRTRLSYITQKPRIFAGTIGENIGFARQSASRSDIVKAAGQALVTEFSDILSEGLDTFVGEGGIGLSGGQAHRVGLARLFLTDPGLIILDEPTAHLDPRSRDRVLEAIFEFALGRTLIILTHEEAVARRADKIMRMAGGTLVAMPHRRAEGPIKREDRA